MTRVHLLHAPADRSEAAAIARILERRGCRVTSGAPEERKPADVLCPLLTPASVHGDWPPLPRGVRVTPILLRDCAVPAKLLRLRPVDACDGVDAKHVRMAIRHAVLGDRGTSPAAIERERRRFHESRQAAPAEVPDLAAAAKILEPVAHLPVREMEIRLDPSTFPPEPGTFLELRLLHAAPSGEPLSFLFAAYREGTTWPRQLGVPEAPYTAFFDEDAARIDARLLWHGNAWVLEQIRDQTDLGDARGTWRVVLDGAALGPSVKRGRAPVADKPREVASLASLAASGARFEMIEHRAGSRRPQRVDLNRTDVRLSVHAFFATPEPVEVRLFQSRHDRAEIATMHTPLPAVSGPEPEEGTLLPHLRAATLADMASPVLREAILGLDEPLRREAEARRNLLRKRTHALLRRKPTGDPAERRAGARLHRLAAGLALARGQLTRAIEQDQEAMRLLEPLALDGPALYEDAIAMFRSARRVVDCFLELEEIGVAAGLSANLRLIAERLIEIDAAEPDYRRFLAEAYAVEASIAALRGDRAGAMEALDRQVTLVRSLCRAGAHRVCVRDWQIACEQAAIHAAQWGLGGDAMVARWKKSLAKYAPVLAPGAPAWCGPGRRKRWPIRAITSPLVRCRAGVPAGWDASHVVHRGRRETAHLFRGTGPEEFLEIALAESSGPPFDASASAADFPLPGVFAEGRPKLLSWGSEGDGAASLVRRLDVEQLTLYQGVFASPPPGSGLGRLYMLVARRGKLWWRVVLSLPTACPPGTPVAMVEQRDHTRAAGVFGALELL